MGSLFFAELRQGTDRFNFLLLYVSVFIFAAPRGVTCMVRTEDASMPEALDPHVIR